MKDPENKSNKENSHQKEPLLNLLPLTLIFCSGAAESICSFIYKDRANSEEERSRYSWIGFNATIIRMLGSLFAGILMEKLNRIIAIHLSFLLLIIGLLLVYLVDFKNSIFFCFGDLIIKFASGMEVSSIVYIAEYNSPKRRSKLLLSVVPVMLLSYYMPSVIRSYYNLHPEYEEILILISICIAFLCLSYYYVEVPIGKHNKIEPLPATEVLEEEKKSSDMELEECSTSSCNSDGNPQAKLPQWMDRTYPAFAISFLVLFSIWPKVGLTRLVEKYKRELMLEREEQIVDNISSLVMLIFSIAGCLFLNYFRRRTFMTVYSLILFTSSISSAIFEFLFDGVESQYKPPGYSFIPLINVWFNLGMATIGSWAIMILAMGELMPSRKRGLVTGILWSVMILQTFVVQSWLVWIDTSMSLYKFHLLMVFVAFKIFMWARSYNIDGREKTQEQIDLLWEDIIARRKTRYKFYRRCLACCRKKEEPKIICPMC